MAKQITYLTQTLSKGEEILGVAEPHWIVYCWPVFWLLVGLMLIHAIVGIFIIIWAVLVILSYCKTEMIATNKRVIIKKGIIAVKTSELLNSKIESVSFNQGIFGRLLGYGTLLFSGTGTTRMDFKDVKDPVFVKSKFEDIIEKNKK